MLLTKHDNLLTENETLKLELDSAKRKIERLKAKDERETYEHFELKLLFYILKIRFIRSTLNEMVEKIEKNLMAATARAQKAEQRVQDLERQLAGAQVSKNIFFFVKI